MSRSHTRNLFVFLGICAVACLIAAGCRRSSVRTVPVKGRITWGGGGWPRKGMIFFAPVEPAPGLPTRGGMADFDTEGNFVAGTFAADDGLIPGKYLVHIQCWEISPGMGTAQPAKSYVPEAYRQGATSGLNLTVPPDHQGVLEANFDIPR